MVWCLPKWQKARTRVGIIPNVQSIKSMLCGDWFINTPPPSWAQVARHEPEL